MTCGGTPYYMNYFGHGLSLTQDVDLMLFAAGAQLRNEYGRLFASVFSNPDMMMSIVGCLRQRSAGFTRGELVPLMALAL